MSNLEWIAVPDNGEIQNRLLKSLKLERCLTAEDVVQDRIDYTGIITAHEIIGRLNENELAGKHRIYLTIAESRVCNAGLARDEDQAYVVLTTGFMKVIYHFCLTMAATQRLSGYLRGVFEIEIPRTIINPWERSDFIRSMSTEAEEREVSSSEWIALGMPDDIKKSIREYFSKDIPFQPTPPADINELTENLFSLCLCFIVFHELGHLILRHAEVRESVSDDMFFLDERDDRGNHEARVAEMEADRFALSSTIFEAIQSLTQEDFASGEGMYVRVAQSLAAQYIVLTLLLSVKGNDATFIINSSTSHPHALLRHVLLTFQLKSILEDVSKRFSPPLSFDYRRVEALFIEGDSALHALEASFCEYDTMRLGGEEYGLARSCGSTELAAAAHTSKVFGERRARLPPLTYRDH